MLTGFTILDFDSKAARQSAAIVKQLKNKRKSIDKPDLFIAATAIVHGLMLDTSNKKHFELIENLKFRIFSFAAWPWFVSHETD